MDRALSGVRILLVDDDKDSLEMVAFVLRSQGAEVTPTTNADDALQVFLGNAFDLLLSDIAMPEHDGLWLIRQIRSMPRSYGGNVVAVAITTHASKATEESVLSAGYQLRIAKPAEPVALVSQLQAVLANVPS